MASLGKWAATGDVGLQVISWSNRAQISAKNVGDCLLVSGVVNAFVFLGF